ncbi:hypothetical protein EON65_00715 [archaeon]|nr:MAG: hypothetical protein EON65_00715 [archaeon]
MQIILRQEADTHLINEVQNGEALIKSLHERNITMEKSLREAKILQDGYMELLKALKMNPPYNEAHVKALEVEVDLAKKQFDDLCTHRNKLYIEGEKLDHVRKRQLLERINYFQVARQEITAKKKVVGKEVKHLKLTVGDKKSRDHRSRDKEKRRRREHNDGMHSDRSNSSDDSDSSKESLKDMTLTQPVIHFINALVRKVTYNEPIIKETDKSLDDVKKRSNLPTDNTVSTSEPGHASVSAVDATPAAPTNVALMQNLMKKKGRMTEFHTARKTVRGGESDSDSVATSLQSQAGGVAFRNNNYGGGMAIAPPSYNLSNKKKLTNDEVTQLKDSIKSIVNVSKDGGRDNFKAQLQKALALMLQKTESNSFDEFLDRYVQGQNLLETLRSQQVLVDSRLAQLRAEHAELYSIWSDISFLAEEQNSANTGVAPLSPNGSTLPVSPVKDTVADENSDRYLDNQLFAKEVRMHHYQRMFDKSVHVISEAKTAISHIMGLLKVNSRLLSALPRSTAPELQTDQDMVPCLSWCEDRIIALNEALTMDANRPNAGANEEKSKPMPQRQADLADEIYKMVYERKNRKSNYKVGCVNR